MEKPKITICMGSSCFSRGNALNLEFCEEFLERRGLKDEVDVDLDGSLCTGNCANGPVVIVNGRVHTRVDRSLMSDMLAQLFPEKQS